MNIFVKIVFVVLDTWLYKMPSFMVNIGFPYNDLVICKDSTDDQSRSGIHVCTRLLMA